MKITRVYMPQLWLMSFFGSGLFDLVMAAAILIAILSKANGVPVWAALATLFLVSFFSVGKAVLRLYAVRLALPQFEQLSKTHGIRLSWTALLGGGGLLRNSSVREQLERSAALRASGADVWPQVACRPLVLEFTFKEPFLLDMNPVFNKLSGADPETRTRAYASSEFRAAFARMIDGGPLTDAFSKAVVSFSPRHPDFQERTLPDLAKAAAKTVADFLLDLVIEDGSRVTTVYFMMSEDNLRKQLRLPWVSFDSDAPSMAPEGPFLKANPHPRAYGTFARVLGKYVRDEKVLSLPDAIRRLTSFPAETLKLDRRGRLQPGYFADVVVFDPGTVGASGLRRVRDLPAQADRLVADATGIDAVIVNGQIIRREGKDVVDPEGPLPGRLLRNGVAAE